MINIDDMWDQGNWLHLPVKNEEALQKAYDALMQKRDVSDEPRGDHGRWTGSGPGGEGSTSQKESNHERY